MFRNLCALALGLLLAGGPVRAQAPAAPSEAKLPPALRAKLRAARTDSTRYAIHLEAVNAYVPTLDSAGLVGNLRACLRLGRRLGDSVRVGTAIDNEGMYNLQVGRLGAAARLLRQADAVLSTSPDTVRAEVAYHLSYLYDDLNRPDQALYYGRLSLQRLRGAHGTNRVPGERYSLLGTIHLGQGRVDSAVFYYQKSLALSRQYHNLDDQATNLGNLAAAFLRHNDLPVARRYAQEAYALSRATHDSLGVLACAERLGVIALRSGQPQAARNYFREMALLARRTHSRHLLPDACGKLAQAQEQLHLPDSARYYHGQARRLSQAQQLPGLGLVLAEDAGFEQRQRRYPAAEALARQALALDGGRPNIVYSGLAWQVLRTVAERRGDFATAYGLLRREQDFVATHQRQENERLTETLRISYETEQAEQRVRLLEQSQELTRLRHRQQTAGLGALGALALALGGGLFWQFRRRQADHLARHDASLRQRLAADLHDDVGALLTQISLQSDLLREAPAAPAQTLARLHRLSDTSRRAARQMADVVWGLHTSSAELPEVLVHMRDHAHEVLPAAGLQVDFAVTPAAAALRPSVAVCQTLYLIYKEALHNAVKHARQASQVNICLSEEAGQLCLCVADNAPGPAPAARSGGHGLANMRQRAEAVGGTLRVDAAAAGFNLLACLPG